MRVKVREFGIFVEDVRFFLVFRLGYSSGFFLEFCIFNLEFNSEGFSKFEVFTRRVNLFRVDREGRFNFVLFVFLFTFFFIVYLLIVY